MAFLAVAAAVAALLQPSLTVARQHALQQRRRISSIRCSSDDWLNGDARGGSEEIEEAQVFRKKGGTFRPHKPKDNRDKLLFDVTEITPPPTKLGVFRLEPSAACGDLISARVRVDGESEKVEQPFIIKKVSYRYAYQQGSYKMVSKGADVKMASRDSTEKFLTRMLPSQPVLDGMDDGALDRAPSSRREGDGQ